MAFTSVPETRLTTDIMKTWLVWFSSEADFSDVNVVPEGRDVDESFRLPSLVLRRVSPEDLALTRVAGYHGEYSPDDNSKVGRLEGFTYMCSFQFDVLASSILEVNRIASLVLQKLKHGSLSDDVFASVEAARQTVIPLLDFASPTTSTGTATDLNIRFRAWRDVNSVKVPTFDPELHQISISVEFWVDYLKPRDVDKISAVTQVATHAT